MGLMPKQQNTYAKSGSAAEPPMHHLRGRRGVPPMKIALSLMSFGFAVVMAIPLLGPMLLAH